MYARGETFVYDVRQKPVGRGAMGTVYMGVSTRDRRPVAIKMVNPQYANIPSVRRRARQEADLQFRHPHLIEMLGCCDFGTPQGPMYIVSNFIKGITLDEHVKQNLANFPDRVNRVCQSVMPVLEALDFLHEKNIYHLDIKPGNIMVENGRNIRLMDMGIANARGEAEITSAGLLGTPGYAAPEQYVEPGKPMQIDGRTDIYELGVTLYELLAGEKPNPQSPAHIRGVNNAVMKVIWQAMAHNPDHRFQTARQMHQALQQAIVAPPKKGCLGVLLALAVPALAAVAALAALVVML